MANLAKVFKFSFSEIQFLIEAWCVFLKWDFYISYTSYEKWRSKITITANNDNVIPVDNFELPKAMLGIIKLSEIAGRFHPRKMNCLRRCLAQKQLLAKRGFETRMHIGVNIKNNQVKAHSWLSYHGKVINDTNDVNTRYSELKTVNQDNILTSLK